MQTLYQWKLRDEDGYLFCTGMLNGHRWETSDILSLYQEDTHYVIETLNSRYKLYFASRRY